MNKDEIMKQVEVILDERTGDKTGGSGHQSSVSISDIKIDEIKEKADTIEIKVTYTVDILSEFSIAEEPDPTKEPNPDNPYHYKKTEMFILKK